MKFKFNQLVKSVDCFYEGFFGKIKSYKEIKTNIKGDEKEIIYSVEGNFNNKDKLEFKEFKETELKRVLFNRKW
jgi:hypothetical protein